MGICPIFHAITIEKVTEKEVDVSCVDFAVMELKELIINENLHSNLFRWSSNVSTHEVIDYQDVVS